MPIYLSAPSGGRVAVEEKLDREAGVRSILCIFYVPAAGN